MIPTNKFRQYLGEINDGNGDIKVMLLQQWYSYDGCIDSEHGEWVDVPVVSL
jgi:hypothetical protein